MIALTVSVLLSPLARGAAKELPAAKPLVAERINRIEREIAARMMARPQTQPGSIPRLELEIDLRIVSRWAFQSLADAKADADATAILYLRAMSIDRAATALEEAFAQPSTPLGRAQNEALVRLRQITYGLPINPNPVQLDELCNNLALTMQAVAGPIAADPRFIVLMRPAPHAPGKTPRPNDESPPRTPAELVEQVRAMNLSPGLRGQLIEVGRLTGGLMEDPSQAGEAKLLMEVLSDSVDLAAGLAGSPPGATPAKTAIEINLAEGLALFSDPRTRSAGRSRIDSLSVQRKILSRMGKLELAPQVRQKIAPALAWSQDHPEQADVALGAIQTYTDSSARVENSPAATTVPPAWRSAADELRKQFHQRAEQFLTEANEVGDGAFATSPQTLQASADELRRLARLIEQVSQLDATMQSIAAFRPRPTGALERRVALAVQSAINPTRSPARSEADSAIGELHRLRRLIDDLNAAAADVPQSVATSYAAGQLGAFDTRSRAMVSDLASQLGTGSTMDRARLDRLHAGIELREALRIAGGVEFNVSRLSLLDRWVDFSLAPDEFAAIIGPYRAATAAAVSGFIAENDEPIRAWRKVQNRYAPYLAWVNRAASYADACNALPSQPLVGELGRLITPLADNKAFDAERYASFVSWLWAAAERSADYESADTCAQLAARRLSRELRLPYKDEPDSKPAPRKAK